MAQSQSNSRLFRVSVPGEPCYLKGIRAFLKTVLEEEIGGDTDRVILAVDECCSNILKHRSHCQGDSAIEVVAECSPHRLRLRISDYCHQDDVPRIQPRELEDVRPGGLGTHFVQSIMDHVVFEPRADGSGGMDLVLEKILAEERSPDADPSR